jgi:PHD/YefM family antitoxin component YafN of YafNO toxin-antitoxin module
VDLSALEQRVAKGGHPGLDGHVTGVEEDDALQETAYLLRSPVNAQRLRDADAALRAGRGFGQELAAKTSKRSGSRGGSLRVEAARINVKVARELGRTPDARIVKIAREPLGDNTPDAMATREVPQPLTTGEARRRLNGILRTFRENSTGVVPVVFGARRRAEAVIIPFDQFEALLSIAEDHAIAPMVTERLAAGGGHPFNELLNERGMLDLTTSTEPHPLD